MKRIFTFMAASFIIASTVAQTTTLTFNGDNRNRNYQAVIDGVSYYSNNTGTTTRTTTTTNSNNKVNLNLQPGAHTIEVFRYRNTGTYTNGTTNASTSGTSIYSKTFQIRDGYDMGISIEGNGGVNFKERRVRNRNNRNQSVSPMADATFNQLVQNVQRRWSTSQKVTMERDAFNVSTNYFTSAQVKQLLQLISSESYRLSLAKLAYPRVTDPSNFTMIYDGVFNTIASRDDMNTFIRNNPNNNNRYSNNNNNNNSQYKTAMADYQFNQLLQGVNGQWQQTGKYSLISDAFSNTANYFSTAQIRQLLSTINSETDRLALAKISYARVSDSNNFTSLYDLFYIQSNRDELNNFINGNTNYNQTGTRTAMADYQFNQLLSSVTNQYYQADRIVIVRNALNSTTNYFTAAQLRSLLYPITSESEKLTLAKQGYLRVTDAANFGVLFDLFTTQSNRDELNTYVRANGGTSFNTNVRTAMSDAAFNQVLQKVSNHFLPWDKVRDAKEAFNNTSNYFTTYQIRQILSVISGESDRLDVAKLAHRTVTDPNNFLQLLDMFTSQTSKDDLTNYANTHSY